MQTTPAPAQVKDSSSRLKHTSNSRGGIDSLALHGDLILADLPNPPEGEVRKKAVELRKKGAENLAKLRLGSSEHRTSAVESEIHIINPDGGEEPIVAEIIKNHPELVISPAEYREDKTAALGKAVAFIQAHPEAISERLKVHDEAGTLLLVETAQKIFADERTNKIKELIGAVMSELAPSQIEQASPIAKHKKEDSRGYQMLHLMQHVFNCAVSDIASRYNCHVFSSGSLPTTADPKYTDKENVVVKDRYLELIRALAQKEGSHYSFETKDPNGKPVEIILEEEHLQSDEVGNSGELPLYRRKLTINWGDDSIVLDHVTLTSERYNTSAQYHSNALEDFLIEPRPLEPSGEPGKLKQVNRLTETGGQAEDTQTAGTDLQMESRKAAKRIQRDPGDALVVAHRITEISGIFDISSTAGSPIINGVLTGSRSLRPWLFMAGTHPDLFGGGESGSYMDNPFEDIVRSSDDEHLVLSKTDKKVSGLHEDDVDGFDFLRDSGIEIDSLDINGMLQAILAGKETWAHVRACSSIAEKIMSRTRAGGLSPVEQEIVAEKVLMRWIESRESCNLPSDTDRTANKVYRDGMTLALQEYFTEQGVVFDESKEELEKYLPYERLNQARDEASVNGMSAEIPWINGTRVNAREFALKELIPRSRRLLKLNGDNPDVVDAYMDIIEMRHQLQIDPASVIARFFNDTMKDVCKREGLSKREIYAVDQEKFPDPTDFANQQQMRKDLLAEVLIRTTLELRKINTLDRRVMRRTYDPQHPEKVIPGGRGVGFAEYFCRYVTRKFEIEQRERVKEEKGPDAVVETLPGVVNEGPSMLGSKLTPNLAKEALAVMKAKRGEFSESEGPGKTTVSLETLPSKDPNFSS